MTTRAVCLVVLMAVCASATGYILSRRTDVRASNNLAQSAAASNRLSREKVNRNLLPNRLRWALNELGNRLEQPGKERLIVTGELQRRSGSVPVQLILEFPGQLRLVVQDSSTYVVTFDGNEAKVLGSLPDVRERDLIESIVHDSVDHFFTSQRRGAAVNALGSRFLSDDGTYRDIYELTDSFNGNAGRRVHTKTYHFNSDTLMLEKVRYLTDRGEASIQVETRFADWQTTEQQKLPTRITRLENGDAVWTLLVKSIALRSMSDDGIFNLP